MKTSLTFEEKITAAYMHYVRKVEQQDICVLYSVNIGRISEACTAIKKAAAGGVIDISDRDVS